MTERPLPKWQNRIGSVSDGESSAGLIQSLLTELDKYDPEEVKRYRDEVGWELMEAWLSGDEIDMSALLNELIDSLDEHALPYFFFGALTGDMNNYGWWLRPDWEETFEGLKVNDTSDIPSDYEGEVAVVSDHGNISLYQSFSLKEIWAVV